MLSQLPVRKQKTRVAPRRSLSHPLTVHPPSLISSLHGTARSRGWPSTASWSCAIACTWNRDICLPTPSTSNWRPCAVWLAGAASSLSVAQNSGWSPGFHASVVTHRFCDVRVRGRVSIPSLGTSCATACSTESQAPSHDPKKNHRPRASRRMMVGT
jgi:hypothetical protein